jgi:hypothetical protein
MLLGETCMSPSLGSGFASFRHAVVTVTITAADLRDRAEPPAFTSDAPQGHGRTACTAA